MSGKLAMLVALCLGGSALADAKSDFEMLFGAEAKRVEQSAGTADDAAFAAKLLESAKSLGDSPDLQALIYRKAYALGVRDPAGCAKALEAVELLGRAVPDKAPEWQAMKLEALKLQFESSRGEARKEAAKPYVDALMEMAEALLAGGKADEADELYAKAFTIATYIRSPRTTEIVAKRRELARQAAALKTRDARLHALQARLQEDPEDAKARQELVLLYLLELDKPDEAAKLLTGDLDEALRTYVPLAAKPLEEIPEAPCLELAVWYEELAAKAPEAGKAVGLRRAAAYYRRYLEVHTKQDAPALKAKLSLAAIEKALAQLGAKGGGGGAARTLVLDLGKGVKMNLVLIPPGTFLMGSPDNEVGREPDGREGPRHRVTISKPFYMGIYEVTQEEYEAVMGKNPGTFKGLKNPVEMVSWDDAVEFCKKASAKTGRKVRLPTEAQWEYACRAGTKTRYSFGDDEKQLGDYAWYNGNSGAKTHPVGQKKPNPAGLYDMHGNVWEWCSGWYAGSYANATSVDPTGPASGTGRVLRGGCWDGDPAYCRSPVRRGNSPGYRHYGFGFRVSVELK